MTTVEKCPESVTNDLSVLWLEITAKCNLSCSHCYADSGPHGDLYGSMAYGDWRRALDEAADLGCRSVQFIGGEPTMHPRLHDLVDHANHRGFEFIEVFTNATRLDQRLIGCLQRNRVHVAASFYSDDPIVHEEVTQVKGSWQRTVRGIESALAAGLSLRAGVIETDANRGHAARAVEFLKKLGVQNTRVDRERGVGRGKLVQLIDQGERYEELCGQRWKGKLCVTSGGDVFPCVFSRATRLGDAKYGLRRILQSATLTIFRNRVRALHERAEDCTPSGHCAPLGDDCVPRECSPKADDNCGPRNGNCGPRNGDCGPRNGDCAPRNN
jgi:MoaA/NifB/PqqE/SkfB family radical SAM enzyme